MDSFVTFHRTGQYKRTSTRLLNKDKEEEQFCRMKEGVMKGTNELMLEVCYIEGKGRGVRALKSFEKEEFVVEYKGELIGSGKALIRDRDYAKDESIGSFMYFFKHNAKSYCVDATKETEWKGRLVNHSCINPNTRTKIHQNDEGRSDDAANASDPDTKCDDMSDDSDDDSNDDSASSSGAGAGARPTLLCPYQDPPKRPRSFTPAANPTKPNTDLKRV